MASEVSSPGASPGVRQCDQRPGASTTSQTADEGDAGQGQPPSPLVGLPDLGERDQPEHQAERGAAADAEHQRGEGEGVGADRRPDAGTGAAARRRMG